MRLLSDWDKAARIAKIIDPVRSYTGRHQQLFDEIHRLSGQESRWGEAEGLFGRIRTNITNKLPTSAPHPDRLLADVAEKCCKVLANGVLTTAKYDANSYDLLLRQLTAFIESLDDEARCQILASLRGILPVTPN